MARAAGRQFADGWGRAKIDPRIGEWTNHAPLGPWADTVAQDSMNDVDVPSREAELVKLNYYAKSVITMCG